MSIRRHWETVYREKSAAEVSWYRPHLEVSLRMIEDATSDRDAPIIDVGGGASTLVDDLLAQGYRNISVLDISGQALGVARTRLGEDAACVDWLVADVASAELPASHYAVWHDRAVFHFLVQPNERSRYIDRLRASLAPDGQVVIATFGPNGPVQCSGLDVQRYDLASLQEQLGTDFGFIDSAVEQHGTPRGVEQEFLYARFRFHP